MTDNAQTKTVRCYLIWNGSGRMAKVGPYVFYTPEDAERFIRNVPSIRRDKGFEADAQAWEREAHTVVPVDVPMPQEGVGK